MASKNLDIIPECYIDTNLISTILNCDVNHQFGCNQVANTMKKFPADPNYLKSIFT